VVHYCCHQSVSDCLLWTAAGAFIHHPCKKDLSGASVSLHVTDFFPAIGRVLVPLIVSLSSSSIFSLMLGHWRCAVPSHHRL
jgi:hypothetical protein